MTSKRKSLVSYLTAWMDDTRIVQSSDTGVDEKLQTKIVDANHCQLGTDINLNRPLLVSDISLNTHMLVAGTTGGGKTVTVANIVQSFIDRGLPIIFLDGKGDAELRSRVIDYGISKGRSTFSFDMNSESQGSYNPLRSGGFTSKKDRLVELREWSEDHYRKLAEGYLQTVFKVLQTCRLHTDLLAVSEYFDIPKLAQLLRQNKDVIGADQLTSLLVEIEGQAEAAKVVASLKAEIVNLGRSEISHLFRDEGEATLNIASTIKHGGVAYISLSPLKFPAFSDTLGKLVLNDLKASLDPRNPQKVLLVIDEFTTVAGTQVLNLLNQGRSLGLHAILTVQSLADLGQKIDRNPELFVDQVLANCNIYCVHRLNNATDAERIAASIGTKQKLDLTSQIDDLGATGMGSMRKVREFLAHPDDIKTLRTGEAFYADKPLGQFAKIKVNLPILINGDQNAET